MKLPSPAAALVKKTSKPPTLPNDYKQYLPFLPFKIAALLAWGHSAHVERVPGGLLVIHLTAWSAELGNLSQRVRKAFAEAERMGLITNLNLSRGVATCRLAPVKEAVDDTK